MPSTHQWIHLFASTCEISGTFLLAVEAIKVSNLKAVREKFFGKLVRLLTPRIKVPLDASPEEIASRTERAQVWVFVLLASIGFGVLFTLALSLLGSTSALQLSVRQALPTEAWQFAIAAILGTILLFGFSALLGFVLYSILLLPFKATFRSLAWIEAKTSSGVIGILGFFIFVVGAVIHAVQGWHAP